MSAKIKIRPAVIFAKSRIINAMGFVKSMELLTNYDNPDGKRMVFIFYRLMK
jgi:hypothetical protein